MSSLAVESGSDDRKFGDSSNEAVQLDFTAMRAYVSGMTGYISSRVTMDTVRPLPMFLGISGPSFCLSPEAFNPPIRKVDKSSPEKTKSRLKLNLSFFMSNYAIVVAGVALVTALMHPGMLLALGLLWSLWGLHSFLISNELVVFGLNLSTLLSINQRSNALVAITTLVIVWKCLFPAITVVIISGVLIFAHALFRDPKHIDASSSGRFGNDTDDDSGEDSHESEVLVEKPGQV